MERQGNALVRHHALEAIQSRVPSEIAPQIEKALIDGDLKGLAPEQRVQFYHLVCESVGLNPLTRPFDYIVLNGKLTMYARKDCTEQLRKIHNVSVRIVSREMVGDAYTVKSQASLPGGRQDESVGAVSLKGKTGEDYANALMKAETKSKRRVTLSICGLGFLDESEVEPMRKTAFSYEPDTSEAPAQLAEAPSYETVGAEAEPPKVDTLTEDDIRDLEISCQDMGITLKDLELQCAKGGYPTLEQVPRTYLGTLHKWIKGRKK